MSLMVIEYVNQFQVNGRKYGRMCDFIGSLFYLAPVANGLTHGIGKSYSHHSYIKKTVCTFIVCKWKITSNFATHSQYIYSAFT